MWSYRKGWLEGREEGGLGRKLQLQANLQLLVLDAKLILLHIVLEASLLMLLLLLEVKLTAKLIKSKCHLEAFFIIIFGLVYQLYTIRFMLTILCPFFFGVVRDALLAM